ncbi:hypothetical protein [Nocardia camponoti]|uniref:Uncharacterized protein n=1 Tax=Nocardia camponoti TaxID=1616106 RepID=A0A917VAN9_9NOCA|nr:hypothetical protein [Nocardia camponoti]GGK55886.1 hypothetical protein GCM10011591_29810 [Nocardia camponoti]
MSTQTPPPEEQAPLRAALRYGLIGLGVLVVLSVIVATALAGIAGLWGAVFGCLIGGGFILTTVISVILGAKLPPTTAHMVMLVSWVGKLLVALVLVAILNQFDFYSRPALFFTVVGALIIVLGAETYGVVSQKVPYVTTRAGDSETASEQE